MRLLEIYSLVDLHGYDHIKKRACQNCNSENLPCRLKPDSFPVPIISYLKAMKGWGRNYAIVKIGGYAGTAKKFVLPLTQCALVKSFSGTTANESGLKLQQTSFSNVLFHLGRF